MFTISKTYFVHQGTSRVNTKFVGFAFIFLIFFHSLVFSNTYSSFSQETTCPKIDYSSLVDTNAFSNSIFKNQIHLLTNSSLKEKDSYVWEQYINNKKYEKDLKEIQWLIDKNLGPGFWPHQIRFIYVGSSIRNLPGIAALFCREYQTKEIMTLIVTSNFLTDVTIFTKILAHEIYHYMIHIKGNKMPFWLEEGLALNFEETITNNISSAPMMDWHMTKSPWQSLSNLGNSGGVSKEDIYSFYGQANLFIYYLQKNVAKNLSKAFLVNTYEQWLDYLESLLSPRWYSFKDAFMDFQVAKYVNRPDIYNLEATNNTDIYKYTLLPLYLTEYQIDANLQPIDFTPAPLAGFIPKAVERYRYDPNYSIIWLSIEKYYPIRVETEESPSAIPLVIRWK